MNRYTLEPDPRTLTTLEWLAEGVVSAASYRAFPHFARCERLFLQCADGRWVELAACGEDLEFKFEVFTLIAQPAEHMDPNERHDLVLSAPLQVAPLLTESWLEPAQPTGPTLGSNPVAQFIGAPGSAPESASAVCRYLGGVRLRDARGVDVVVATASFPYDLHVTGISNDPEFCQSSYEALGHGA